MNKSSSKMSGARMTDELHRFRPVGCLTNHLDVGMGFKQFLKAFTEQCVFISYQDTHRSLDISV